MVGAEPPGGWAFAVPFFLGGGGGGGACEKHRCRPRVPDILLFFVILFGVVVVVDIPVAGAWVSFFLCGGGGGGELFSLGANSGWLR